MRGWAFASACIALASCGNGASGPPSPADKPTHSSNDVAAETFFRGLFGLQKRQVHAPPHEPDAAEAPPERSLGVYERGGELDPNDLGALARLTGACDGPWAREFLNEPLALQNGRATRDGNVLTIGEGRFENPFAVLSGEYGPRDLDAWEYHYFGAYADTGLDLVHVQYSEGDGYILLDRDTLTAVEFAALPSPSPSGKYFATAVADEMDISRVLVAERTPSGLKMVATFESDRFPCGLNWTSDSKATFQELGPDAGPRASGYWDKNSRSFYRDAAVELRDGAWVYLPAK